MADSTNLLDLLSGGMGTGGLGMPDVQLSDDQKKSMMNSNLMALGAAMLQAGGPQTQKVSVGQALGKGLAAYGQNQNDLQNNYIKNSGIMAQANAMKTDAASKMVTLQMSLDKFNMQRQLAGLPPISMQSYISGLSGGGSPKAGPAPLNPNGSLNTQGMTPPPTAVDPTANQGQGPTVANAQALQGGDPTNGTPIPAPQTQPMPSQPQGYDPNAMDQSTLQAVYQGLYPGSPQQHIAISNYLSASGDEKGAEFHRNLATQGVNGFRPDAKNWNGPSTPLNDKVPSYIQSAKTAESLGDNYGKAVYAAPIANAQEAAKVLAPMIKKPEESIVIPGGVAAPSVRPPVGAGPLPTPNGPAPMTPNGPAAITTPPSPIPSPSVQTPPPVNPLASNPALAAQGQGMKSMAEADSKEVADTRSLAQKGNDTLATIQQIQNLQNQTKTGWSVTQQNQAAKMLIALGVPEDQVKSQFMGLNPAATDMMNKQFLTLSTEAVRGMGSREPGSVISLFGRAYPSVDSLPDTITSMMNAQKMDVIRKQEEAAAKSQYYNNSLNNRDENGQPLTGYRGLHGFDTSFNKDHNPADYAHASAAISAVDAPSFRAATHSNLNALSDSQYNNVISHIPSGTRYMDRNGKLAIAP